MRIYTRTGDRGDTTMFGGERVPKDDLRIEAYGTVDETNAAIGLARATQSATAIDDVLSRAQSELFVLGAELACAADKVDHLGLSLVGSDHVNQVERDIDAFERNLPELKNFVLPAGTTAAAALHVARAVCRRAERRVLAASRAAHVRPELVIYLNRLSDLLFVLARVANREAGHVESLWSPRHG